MKKSCCRYMSEDISRFVDRELSQDLYHELAQHLNHCADCRGLVEHYKAITGTFNDHAQNRNLKIDPLKLKRKIASIPADSQKKLLGNIFGFFNKNIYLKLASIAAIVMISLIVFQKGAFQSNGPSAIVTSVDADFSSVMIIETQNKRHTIIWFSET